MLWAKPVRVRVPLSVLYMNMIISDEDFIKICNDSITMSEACTKTGLHYNTFRKRAIKLNCFKPNQSHKGMKFPNEKGRQEILNKILSGNYPSYQTFKLKKLLFDLKVKENKCEICGITEWLGNKINCELHHIDGNKNNHRLENLQILCPNCHSQTDTFRALNLKLKNTIS